MKWLKKLFRCCEHNWTIIANQDVWDTSVDRKRAIGVLYTLQCTKCGDIQTRKASW